MAWYGHVMTRKGAGKGKQISSLCVAKITKSDTNQAEKFFNAARYRCSQDQVTCAGLVCAFVDRSVAICTVRSHEAFCNYPRLSVYSWDTFNAHQATIGVETSY